MCGGTDAQTEIQDDQMAFYKQLAEQDKITFGQDQGILAKIQSVYNPIFEAGPSQRGFSPEESNARIANAVDTNAVNFRNASKAASERAGATGGGDLYLPSGPQVVAQGQIAQAGAEDLSNAERGIEVADWTTGRENFDRATTALEGASARLSPTAYAGAATSAGSAASKTAKDISDAGMSWMQPLVGAAGAVGGGFLAGRGRS